MQRVRAPLTGKRGRGMTGERGNGEQSENGVEQLFQLADRFNPAIETAAGDLRDLLIDVQRGMTKPWDDLLQIDQEARVRPSELSAEKVTRKLAFPLLSSAFGAKVEQVNVKEKGVAAKFGILHDGDEVLVDTLVHMNMRGRSVVSVLVDPESYMGARAPATSRRDQGDLPLEDQPAGPPDAVHADDQSEKPAAGAGKAAALDGFNETRNPFNHPQLASIYSFDQSEVWAQAHAAAEKALVEANAAIAENRRKLGIPERFAPGLVMGCYGRSENASRERRVELRRVAVARIAAIERDGRRIVFFQKLFSEVPELVGAKSAAYLLLIGGARGSSTNSSIDG